MRLSEFKAYLEKLDKVNFKSPDGSLIPSHFHVTEIGVNRKKFIDCGGNIRNSEKINFQLWTADDFDHNLSSQKLLKIIDVSEKIFFLQDLEIEIEYQQSTIGIFGLEFKNDFFFLTNKETDCLDKEKCGIEVTKSKVNLSEINVSSTCIPGGGCC
jgi:hypothetical protein